MFDDVMRRFKEYTFLPFARRLVRVPPATLSFLSLLMGLLTAVIQKNTLPHLIKQCQEIAPDVPWQK